MTEASDPGQAVGGDERTSEPDLNRVQPGWRVEDRSGALIGVVTERDDVSFVVARGSDVDEGMRIPIRLIADEDPDRRQVTLDVAADELDRLVQRELR